MNTIPFSQHQLQCIADLYAALAKHSPEEIEQVLAEQSARYSMPRCTADNKPIVSPVTDPINRNTAGYQLYQAAQIVAGIAPVAERIEAAYQRDLRRIQQAQFDMAKQQAKATGAKQVAVVVRELQAA